MQDSANREHTRLPFTAVILAGGKSTRMGTDKALLPLGHSTIIEQICAVAQLVFAETLIISADRSKYATLQLRGSKILEDDASFKGNGPLAGIYTGLSHASHTAACFLTCDMPFVDPAILRYLTTEWDPRCDVTCFQNAQGFHEPFPGMYRRQILRTLVFKLQHQEFSLCRYLDGASVRYLRVPAGHEIAFTNTNTPDEYQGALRQRALS